MKPIEKRSGVGRTLLWALLGAGAANCWVEIAAGGPGGLPAARARPDAEASGARCFRMGFTGFPHDFTLEAVLAARKFVRENADIIAHHIEGVPWAEALTNAPFSRAFQEEWDGKKAATPPGGQVYLAISPGQGDLKVAEKGLPLPATLKGKPYDDPLVERAYLNYCRRSVAFFRPDSLAIGIEVNEIFQAGPERWKAYVALHNFTYHALKQEHPHLPIFASFTLHGMLNMRGPRQDAMLAAFQQIMPCNDLMAISFYPFIASGMTRPQDAFAWLNAHFDQFGKPYAVVETGEAGAPLTFPTSRQTIAGTPEKQAAYFRTLLATAEARHFKFVISFIHRDYDALWDKIKGTAPEFFMAWRTCGLVDAQGAPRPAYEVWRSYFMRPLRE